MIPLEPGAHLLPVCLFRPVAWPTGLAAVVPPGAFASLSRLPVFFLLALLAVVLLLRQWWIESRRHNHRLDSLRVRVHVNGIRGKSTVTRLIAGVLREAGLRTVAKTTGTLAAVIHDDKRETQIERRGFPTILEQVEVIGHEVPPGTEAIVVECMALNPEYQAVSEAKLIRSTIGVLTNVREDHQDVMGATLPEIACSLLNTCPQGGTLITAEQDPGILRIVREAARQRGAQLVVVNPDSVPDEDLEGFDYVSFKENMAIGFAVASLLGIPREVALAGMVKAASDPGVLRMLSFRIGEKRVTWANLFAVNDRESVLSGMEIVLKHRTQETTVVGILNNRLDREVRCLQFADIASLDLRFDRLATFGAYESVVTRRLLKNGYPAERIVSLGEQRDPALDDILAGLVHAMPTPHVLLVGLVNIHTKQAEMLLEFLDGLAAEPGPEVEEAAPQGEHIA